ncbi:MAG TPA: O-antigen ligase family protein [bacterium]|nr:O-antigen ligase family protein [bacterium]HPR87466.1 O-antigen ligase family protein [bacterium]
MNAAHTLDARLERITRWSLYLFAAAMPFAIALTQIAVATAAIAWMMRLWYTRSLQWPRLGVEWGFVAFIAAELLACIFSTHLSQNLIYLKRLLLIPIVYIVAANCSGERELRRLGMIFTGAIALYSLWGIGSFLLHPSLRVRHIQNSMTAGGITMVGAVVAMVFALRLPGRRDRLLMAAAAAVSLGCLILTSTRGSWVGFFAAALVILIVQQRKLLLILPVIALAFYLLSPAGFSQRMRHIFDPTWGTNAKRVHWWSVGWEIFKDHPVVGIGDVGTTPMYTRYAPPGEKELIGHFHSNYVHIAVTLGAIGLTAFLFMVLTILVRLAQRLKACVRGPGWSSAWALAALAAAIAFHINGFFEWNFGDQEIITMIWFITGIGLGLDRHG